MATNYVIVISVLEGKNFPVRHDKYLLVEAKFDGEVMATDPAPHILHPHFNTELAWEVDKKGLQMHRLQRSPIKLQWYAMDMELMKKETIGYMVLDIRLAQEKPQSPKWYPLLNSKYQKEKPEVLLSLYLERVTEPLPSAETNNYSHKRNSFTEEKNGRRRPSSAGSLKPPVPKPCNGSGSLKPLLLSEAGCYQIGPPELCNEKFMFSVTLAFAANLNKLAPPAMLKSSKGFYFCYSLFDNNVTTEKFSSLSSPDFLAERASVRISSSSKLLSDYFEENAYLEIVLCSGDVSLGYGQIPLEPFSCINKHNINEDPLCIEGNVPIIPTEKTSRLGGDDAFPFVGVTVVLQADKPEEKNHLKSNLNHVDEVDSEAEKSEKAQLDSQTLVMKTIGSSKAALSNHNVQKKKTEPDISQVVQSHSNDSNRSGRVSCNHSAITTPMDSRNVNDPSSSVPVKMECNPRHFSFALDLSNFQATRLAHPINLFIRYSYPFFGTTSSMVTHPDVEVHPKCEVNIPHGYCAFNFATTFASLKSTFWETPLILEVLHRKKGGQEQTVGSARVNLFQVLDAPSVRHIVDKKQGIRQMSSCKVVVTSPEGYEIGEIYAVLTLIDFGQTSALCDRHSSHSNISCLPQVRSFIPNFDLPLLRQNGLTQDELLQAALELELWQERQQEIFRAQLKDKEMQHLSVLTSEYKQRDMERELLLQRQIQECRKLEDKLKSTLKDAELKEKQLEIKEKQLSSQEAELQNIEKQLEEQQKETKGRMESMKLEYNEMIALERMKSRDLEKTNNRLLQQIKDLEKELHDQKNLADSLRSQLNKGPDIHLRTEVNILTMEKAELHQKLETALSSKQKYKMQWGQAVRQISLLQQRINMLEQLDLKKDLLVSSVQQQVLSNDAKNSAQTKDKILEMVKDKMDSLKPVISPESLKHMEKQMSLNEENSKSVSTTTTAITSPQQNIITLNKMLSLNSHVNSGSKPLNETMMNEANTNVSSPDFIKHNPKPSLIPQPIKNLPDMNGNTNMTDGNIHLQHLLTKKEALLTTGVYTEDHHLIKDLNAHIEKAKLSSK